MKNYLVVAFLYGILIIIRLILLFKYKIIIIIF